MGGVDFPLKERHSTWYFLTYNEKAILIDENTHFSAGKARIKLTNKLQLGHEMDFCIIRRRRICMVPWWAEPHYEINNNFSTTGSQSIVVFSTPGSIEKIYKHRRSSSRVITNRGTHCGCGYGCFICPISTMNWPTFSSSNSHYMLNPGQIMPSTWTYWD